MNSATIDQKRWSYYDVLRDADSSSASVLPARMRAEGDDLAFADRRHSKGKEPHT